MATGDPVLDGKRADNLKAVDGDFSDDVNVDGDATVSGKVSATEFEGSGAKLTGIAGASGGVSNDGVTTINADANNDGSGTVSIQIQGQEVASVENDGASKRGRFVATTLNAPTKYEIEFNAQMNRLKFGGSGVLEYGYSPETSVYDSVGTGIVMPKAPQSCWWTPNALCYGYHTGYSGTLELGNHDKVVNVNGYLVKIKGTKYTDAALDNWIKFPEATLDPDMKSRQNLMFLEVWHELVEDKDFVYPYGNVQFRNVGGASSYTAPDGTAFTPIVGNFSGYDTYSLFGSWQETNVEHGHGMFWSTLSEAQKKSFIGDKWNNIYINEDGKFVQIRYRIRVEAGVAQGEWTYIDPQTTSGTSVTYFAQGPTVGMNRIQPQGSYVSGPAGGYYVNRFNNELTSGTEEKMVNDGVFYAQAWTGSGWDQFSSVGYQGKCYAIPILLHTQQRNKGAFHPSENWQGTGAFKGRTWDEAENFGLPQNVDFPGLQRDYIDSTVLEDDCADDDTGDWSDFSDTYIFDTDHYELARSATNARIFQAVGFTLGDLYRFKADIKGGAGGSGELVSLRICNNAEVAVAQSKDLSTTTTEFQTITMYFVGAANMTRAYVWNASASSNIEIKNIELVKLTSDSIVNLAPLNCCTDPNSDVNSTGDWGIGGGGTPTLASEAGGVTGYRLKITDDGTGGGWAHKIVTLTAGDYVRVKASIGANSGDTYSFQLYNGTYASYAFAINNIAGAGAGTWDTYDFVCRVPDSGSYYFLIRAIGSSDIVYADNVSLEILHPGSPLALTNDFKDINQAPVNCCTDPNKDANATTGWTAGSSALLSSVSGGSTGYCLKVQQQGGVANPYASSPNVNASPGEIWRLRGLVNSGGSEATYVIEITDVTNSASIYNSGSLESANNWNTEIDQVFEIPPGCYVIQFHLYSVAAASSSLYTLFDNVDLFRTRKGHGQYPNHAPNMCCTDPFDDENNTTGWTQVYATLSSETGGYDNYCLKVLENGGSANPACVYNVDVTPGEYVRLTARVNSDGSEATYQVRIRNNSDMAFLASVSGEATNDWTTKADTGLIKIPAGCTSIKLYLQQMCSISAGTHTLFDSVKLEKVNLDWIVEDPNGRFEITPSTITATGLTRNEDAFIYKDFGTDYFDGDFVHWLKTSASGGASSSRIPVWALTNEIDTPYGLQNNYADCLYINWYNSSGNWILQIYEMVNGGILADSSSNLSADTDYWLEIRRDESVGTYGTIYCDIYNNIDRTATHKVDTITITLTESNDFRYLFGLSAFNAGDDYPADVTVSDLALEVPMINEPGLLDRTDYWAVGAGTLVHDKDHYNFEVTAASAAYRRITENDTAFDPVAGRRFLFTVDVKDGTVASKTFKLIIGNNGMVTQHETGTLTSTTSWVRHKLYWTANGAEEYIAVRGLASFGGNIQFRNVKLIELPSSDLCFSASHLHVEMESNLLYTDCCTDPDNDTNSTGSWTGNATRSVVDNGRGGYALRLQNDSGTYAYRQIDNVVAGEVYRFKGEINPGTSTTYSVGVYNLQAPGWIWQLSNYAASGFWETKFDATVVIPDGCTSIHVYIYTTGGVGTYLDYDNVTFEKVTAVHGGSVGTAASDALTGRPDALYHDSIIERDIIDLRQPARKVTDLNRLLEKTLQDYIAGNLRGEEGVWSIVENGTIDNDAEYYTDTNWGETVTRIVDTSGELGSQYGGAYIDDTIKIFLQGDSKYYECIYKYLVTGETRLYLHPRYGDVRADFTGSSTYRYIVAQRSDTKTANTLLHCDIIGDPANYPYDNYMGTPLLIEDDKDGTSLLPADVSLQAGVYKTFKLSRKSSDIKEIYFKANDGTWHQGVHNESVNTALSYAKTTWSSTNTIGFNWNLSYSVLGYASEANMDSNVVILVFYETAANALTLTVNTEVLAHGPVVSGHARTYPYLLHDLIGKAAIGDYWPLSRQPLTSYAINPAGNEWHTSHALNHAAMAVWTTNNPQYKAVPFMTREYNKLYAQFVFKEMIYDADLGDNGQFDEVDYCLTEADDNSNVVITGHKRLVRPLLGFWRDDE